MRVSVIIPVLNDPRLRQCLEGLESQTLPHSEFEVLVVDNGSENPPRDLVKTFSFARLLTEPKPGSFAARNLALTEARGEVVAFTDSDCIPEKDWLEEGIARIEAAENLVLVGGHVQVFAREDQEPNSAELIDMVFGFNQEKSITTAGYAVTANLFAPRESFEVVGDFNTKLLSGGDGEWCCRAGDAGIPIHYCPTAIVKHPARDSLKARLEKRRRVVGGRIARNRESKRSPFAYIRVVLGTLFPDFTAMGLARRRLRARGYGFGAWLKVVSVLTVMHYAGVLEIVRVRLGDSPKR